MPLTIICCTGRTFSREEKAFLKSKCFLCCKQVIGESARIQHKRDNKRDHFGPCKRCGNHFKHNESKIHHVLEIASMYMTEALLAGFVKEVEEAGLTALAEALRNEAAEADGDETETDDE